MSKSMVDSLSEKERVCLEHVRQAQERELSFAEYCRQQGLKVNQWYWVKQGLMRKGVLARRSAAEESKPVGFVPVRIAPSAAAVVCRVCHPSGWVIECGSFPQAQWLSDLMLGAAP